MAEHNFCKKPALQVFLSPLPSELFQHLEKVASLLSPYVLHKYVIEQGAGETTDGMLTSSKI